MFSLFLFYDYLFIQSDELSYMDDPYVNILIFAKMFFPF